MSESRKCGLRGVVMSRLFVAVSVCLIAVTLGTGQNFEPRSPQRGTSSGSSLAVGDMEAINLESGNLSYKFPLASLPSGRSGAMAPAVYLNYNSKLYETRVANAARPCESNRSAVSCDPGDPNCESSNLTFIYEWCIQERTCWLNWGVCTPWEDIACFRDVVEIDDPHEPLPICRVPANAIIPARQGGWKYGVSYELNVTDRPDTRIYDVRFPPPPHEFVDGWRTEIIAPDGSSHKLLPAVGSGVADHYYNTYPWKTAQSSIWYSVDGSFIRMHYNPNGTTNTFTDDTWILYMNDGTTVHVQNSTRTQTVTDRNGNYFTTTYLAPAGGTPSIKIADQLGREINIEMPSSGPHLVKVKGVGGSDLTTTIDWGNTQPRGKKYEAWTGDYPVYRSLNSFLKVVRGITLPNGLKYNFEYNSDTNDPQDPTKTLGWGELSKVTLPTGAFVEYSYYMDGVHGGNGNTSEPVITTDELLDSFPTRKRMTYEDTVNGQPQTRTET